MIAPRPLSEVAEEYVLTRSLAPCSRYQLLHTLDLYGAWLGHAALTTDLQGITVSRWIEQLATKYATRTIVGHRGNLLGLWRDLAERDQLPAPTHVRKIRRPDPLPIAWTLEELKRLLVECRAAPGTLKDGTPAAIYWEVTVRVAYESGLRRSDLWILNRDQIRTDGSIVLRQHKTGYAHQPRVTPATLILLDKLSRDPPLAWPGRTPRGWYSQWVLIIAAAHVRPGALQQIRRTGATHLYTSHPHDVQRYLGHRTSTMQRHYVDLSLAAPQPHLPPSLD